MDDNLLSPMEKRTKKEKRLSDREDVKNTVEISYFLKTHVLPNLIFERDIDLCVKMSESFFLLVPYIAMGVYYRQREDKIQTFLLFCLHGGLRLAQWFAVKFRITADDAKLDNNFIFRYACRNGHLEVAKWLESSFGLTADYLTIMSACANGYIEVVKWLVDRFDRFELSTEIVRSCHIDLFCVACQNGYLELAKWLVDKFRLTADDARSRGNYAFRYACQNGYLELAKWLVDKFGLTADDVRSCDNCAFRSACQNGHLEVAKWLVDKFGLSVDDAKSCHNYAFRHVCENGDLVVIKWLSDKFGLRPDDNFALDSEEEEEEEGFG